VAFRAAPWHDGFLCGTGVRWRNSGSWPGPCDRVRGWPPEDPFLVAAYVFGDVLDGADPLEAVQVAVAVNLPPQEVPWGSSPHGTGWLADQLRLSKGGFEYWWRSHLDPAWNHYIRDPVRFWSQDGPDEAVLTALAGRRFADLPRLQPSPDMAREQLAGDLDAALRHLRQVRDCYLGVRLAQGAPRLRPLPGTRALGGRRRLPGHPRRVPPALARGPSPVS
jgi:hypothetical protein